MPWELSVAASTIAKSAVSDDVCGANGWALAGVLPQIWTARHLLEKPEAFVIADGIQPGYGALGAQLLAREASTPSNVATPQAIGATIERLHAELMDADYFPTNWGVTLDRLRIPGATIVGCRVDPANQNSGILIFNVGDAGAFVLDTGHLAKQSIDDRVGSGTLTQSIGGGPLGDPKPHIRSLRLGQLNRILLCSDGLTDTLSYPVIDKAVSRAKVPKETATNLLKALPRDGMLDDVTVIVIDVTYSRPQSMPRPTSQRRN